MDGGTASQVFLYPADLNWSHVIQALEVPGTPEAYVIRNSRLEPDWGTVYPKSVTCTGFISAVRETASTSTWLISPEDFDLKPDEEFDLIYMGKLFDLGHDLALNGYPWEKAPPGFE